jgi:hypothetical protein
MRISKLLKHWNLNPAKLKFILKRYNVNYSMRFIKVIVFNNEGEISNIIVKKYISILEID